MKFPFLTIVSILVILFSCTSDVKKERSDINNNPISSHSAKASPPYDTTLTTGTIVAKVICKNDSSQSYALYLPVSYDTKKSWPVIYFFDPHADGVLPLEKYKNLADKYGYVIAGSNNSKNGNDWKTTYGIVNTFFNDVISRINIESRRIYTAGFSGGSRVASSAAIFNGRVKGVIGCGAGFPNIDQPIQNRFDFIGIAGEADFNSTELKQLDKSLERSQLRHQLLTFDGKHEWCPAEVMEEAFVWTELNAMKDNVKAKNDTLINHVIAENELLIKKYERQKNSYHRYLVCKKLVSFCDGLSDITPYKKMLVELEVSEEIKRIVQQNELNELHEMQIQQQYAKAIQTQNYEWWQSELNRINAIIKQNTQREDMLANKRLLSYLSLAAYMNANGALKAGQQDMNAENFIKIYKLIDPVNAEAPYLAACLYAKRGNNNIAVSELKAAVKLGFNDVVRLQNDPMFASIKKTEGFVEIIKNLQK